MAGYFTFISQLDEPIRSFGAPPDGFLRRQNFPSKTLRLHDRAPSQIVTAESGRKSKIVLDSRTHAGLAARRFAFNHHCVQALRRTLNEGRQSCRSATYNRQIVKVSLRTRSQAHFLRNICREALQKLRSVREKYD